MTPPCFIVAIAQFLFFFLSSKTRQEYLTGGTRPRENVLFSPVDQCFVCAYRTHARGAGWESWSGGEQRAKQAIRRLCNTPVHCARSQTSRHLSSPCEHACTVPSRTSLPRRTRCPQLATHSAHCHVFQLLVGLDQSKRGTTDDVLHYTRRKPRPLATLHWRASLVPSVLPALCGTAATGAGVGDSEPSALRGVGDSWPLAAFSRGRLGAGDKHKAPPPCGRRLCASYVTEARGGGASSLVYCTVEHRVPGRLVVVAVVCYGIIDSQTDSARRTWPADWHISQPSDESEQKYRSRSEKVGPFLIIWHRYFCWRFYSVKSVDYFLTAAAHFLLFVANWTMADEQRYQFQSLFICMFPLLLVAMLLLVLLLSKLFCVPREFLVTFIRIQLPVSSDRK